MNLGLTGKVAIVTGGSYGIGKGIALQLAKEGANVAICARREGVLAGTATEIEAKTGRKVLALVADAGNPEDIKRCVGSVLERFGRIDILVNNAGASNSLPFEQVSDELWLDDLNLKVMGAIRFSRLCIPEMRKVGGGRIINITMIGGKQPRANNVPTSTSRAAGIALTKALSKDLAVDNILVNTVCVGKIRSGQHERRYPKTADQTGDLDAYYASLSHDIPLKRFGLPEEVGDLVAFLASERAKYITGDAINIDGGTSGAV
jgi:3-oxoacyl-[acyl-carrier protein] reductase